MQTTIAHASNHPHVHSEDLAGVALAAIALFVLFRVFARLGR